MGHLIVEDTWNMQSAFSTSAVWGHAVPSLKKKTNCQMERTSTYRMAALCAQTHGLRGIAIEGLGLTECSASVEKSPWGGGNLGGLNLTPQGLEERHAGSIQNLTLD